MFSFDTGADGGGSKGPWLGFKPKGSAKYGIPYNSWVMRSKNEAGGWDIRKAERIEKDGLIFDMVNLNGTLGGTLKLGWEKSDGQAGQAPVRQWWKSPMQKEPRPDDSRTLQGGYVWRNAVSIRVAAMGDGREQVATWEDAGWGTFKGMSDMLQLVPAGFEANPGKYPHVKCVGYEPSGQGQNSTSIPRLEIIAWVDQPACFKEDAPTFQADSTPAAQQSSIAAELADGIPF